MYRYSSAIFPLSFLFRVRRGRYFSQRPGYLLVTKISEIPVSARGYISICNISQRTATCNQLVVLQGVFLHILADTLGSVGVIVSGRKSYLPGFFSGGGGGALLTAWSHPLWDNLFFWFFSHISAGC